MTNERYKYLSTLLIALGSAWLGGIASGIIQQQHIIQSDISRLINVIFAIGFMIVGVAITNHKFK